MRAITSMCVGMFVNILTLDIVNGLTILVAAGFYLLSLVAFPKPKRTVRLYD